MRSKRRGHRVLAIVVAVACAGLIVPGASEAAPSRAVTKKTVYVDGAHLPSTLELDGRECPGPVGRLESVDGYRIARKGPLGSAHGQWSDPTALQAVGLAARVADLTSFESASVQVDSLDPDGSISGVAFVGFAPTETGYWLGGVDLGADQTAGWHQVSGLTDGADLAEVGLKWYHFTPGGSVDETVNSARIDDFALAQGASTGWVGFGFGCDGNGFALDALRVRTASSDTTYNLERPRTEALLSLAKGQSSVVGFGNAVKLHLALRNKATNARLQGTVRLKVSGGKTTNVKVGRSGATVTVKPARQTSISFSYAGTRSIAPSKSRTVTVKVRQQVSARLSSAAVTVGGTVHVRGSVNPHHATSVVLQRKAGRSWRAVSSRKTSGSGAFDFGMRPSGAGTQYLRVLAKAGGGLLENVSRTVKLVVRPKPSSGGGGGGGDGGGDGGGGGGPDPCVVCP